MIEFQTLFSKMDQAEAEELWLQAELERGARRAFRSQRRRGRSRRVLAALGLCLPRNEADTKLGHRLFEIAIDEIGGLAEEGAARGLPALPRALEAAWLERFSRLEEEGQARAFRLRWSGESWLLEGGIGELLRLELLRSRGEILVRAESSAETPLTRVERAESGYPCLDCEGRIAG
jgi:hypothetical protein